MTDDWRAAVPGPALDRLVAERLGWTDIRETEGWYENSESEGWEKYIEGYPPNFDGIGHRRVPDWYRDAAAPLPLAEGEVLEMSQTWKGTFSARIVPATSDKMDALSQTWQHATTLALARVRAWLARDDAKRGGGEMSETEKLSTRSNPIFRQNIITLAKSAGLDVTILAREENRETVLEFLGNAFDFYAKRGMDFGGAILRAIGDLYESLEKPDDAKRGDE